MGDEESEYKVLYEGEEAETNWISKAGKATVTYADGSTFAGTFDEEKLKQGPGVYTWMGPGEEEDEKKVVAVYDGEYKDGVKSGRGKMTFPSGDVYDGFWKDNKMDGEGTYTYKATGDIYSGAFVAGKKSGEGRYEFGADSSQLVGTWVDGSISTGSWELKGAAVYTGAFKNGKPDGEGSFKFESGITQEGSYVAKKDGEEDDEDAPVTITWEGKPVFGTA
ncbi:hypothetical protein TrCOL_g8428 [Triparma columacea]|uniref:MORN repeat-containing protein n=1 Tax=Triparma columacea TaxID=722753 RepID=A0A9W7LDF1_9STRA|nr:hypothetical protein TrCOL_g8428 [Triparma columacea]